MKVRFLKPPADDTISVNISFYCCKYNAKSAKFGNLAWVYLCCRPVEYAKNCCGAVKLRSNCCVFVRQPDFRASIPLTQI